MIPPAFTYHRAASVHEALRLLQELGPEARLLAGGHSLIPMLKLHLAAPAHLIDIGQIADLAAIRPEGEAMAIGAAVPHVEVERSELLRQHAPLLSETAGRIGDVQVRNKGTVGGSLAHADPAADYPAAMLASNAEFVLQGLEGTRAVPATEFFTGLFETALREHEMIRDVRVMRQGEHTGSAYVKFAHPASGFAVVGCAALVTVENETCREVRVAFNGLTENAYRDEGVERALTAQAATDEHIASAAERAGEGRTFLTDPFASAEYRAHLAKVYARRALQAAVARAAPASMDAAQNG